MLRSSLEEALRLRHVAAPHGLFHLLQHAVEVVLRDDAVRFALVRVLRTRIVLHPLGEFAQELVHGLPQFVGQALDLIVGGTALHGLLQAFLGGAQLLFAIGQIAVLDLQRHGPEPIRHLDQGVVAAGLAQPIGGQPQAHEDAPLRREVFRVDEKGIERELDALAVVRGENEVAPLLDQRLGKRIGEGALRQREVDGFAHSLLAGLVLDRATGA